MAAYNLQDIASSISGDIQVNSQGDIKVGSSYETMFNILNFWLRTDHGAYAADFSVGCDIGSFIGSTNTADTLEDMESQISDLLIRNVIYPEDIQVKVVPFSQEEALVAVELRGTYYDVNGNQEAVSPTVLTYSFPYIEGTPDPIVEI